MTKKILQYKQKYRRKGERHESTCTCKRRCGFYHLSGTCRDKYGKDQVIALTVAYGQKHTKEIEASRKMAEYYGVEHLYLDLAPIFRYSDCSLLKHSDSEIPHESYAEQLEETDGTPVSTYVPFRNGLFLSSAASIALSKDCSVIYYGAHADDSAGNAYPDCSRVFHDAINEAIYEGSGGQLRVEARLSAGQRPRS